MAFSWSLPAQTATSVGQLKPDKQIPSPTVAPVLSVRDTGGDDPSNSEDSTSNHSSDVPWCDWGCCFKQTFQASTESNKPSCATAYAAVYDWPVAIATQLTCAVSEYTASFTFGFGCSYDSMTSGNPSDASANLAYQSTPFSASKYIPNSSTPSIPASTGPTPAISSNGRASSLATSTKSNGTRVKSSLVAIGFLSFLAMSIVL
ncbi:hypothetical protein V8E54_007483 [Elaphomyces granulatus]